MIMCGNLRLGLATLGQSRQTICRATACIARSEGLLCPRPSVEQYTPFSARDFAQHDVDGGILYKA